MRVGSERRRDPLRVALLVAVLVVISGLSPRSAAAGSDEFAPKFGTLYEQYDTCGCGQLNGTEASIIPNNMTPGPGTNYCTVFRSDAENTNATNGTNTSYLIQAGIVKCAAGAPPLDQTCSVNNNIVLFVETREPGAYNDTLHCVAHGGTTLGTEHVFTVVNAWQNQWQAYIDGNAYESITGITGMYRIHEGAEAVHPENEGDNCTGFGSPNSATWASDPTWRWQRFRYNYYDWFTIQGSQSSNGCWTISGGPPNSFTISE
jgi:hypothetical protein